MFRPTIIILYTIVICYNITAQNWQLFPANQINHYLVVNDKSFIRSFNCDSISGEDEEQIHFFSRYMGASEKCYWQNFKWLGGYSNEFNIDSLIYNNDSVVYFFLEGDRSIEFVFKPRAQPGDEWNLSSHTYRKGMCISTGISEVLGEIDSIKTFSLQTVLGDVEFILSKTRGLVQFTAFTDFFVEIPVGGKADEFPFYSYNLIGFQNDHELKGFKMPGFSDYFHLSAGDQLLWKHRFYDAYDFITHYYSDSIVTASISENSVAYNIAREIFDLSGQFIRSTDTIISYDKVRYEYLLQTPALWYTTSEETNNSEIFHIRDMKLDFLDEDTVFSKEFSADGCFFDHTNGSCYWTCIENIFYTEYKVSSNMGLTYYSGFYGDELELKGSIINGKLWGSMDIPPVGMERLHNYDLGIYPNPNSGEYILLDLTDIEEPRELIITDLQGKVILRTTSLQDDITRVNINFNYGIYFVNLISKDYTYSVKFVVR